jgi:2-dehydro-3-deoxyphosphooctonate aldolase (KDO 8-P synthase)
MTEFDLNLKKDKPMKDVLVGNVPIGKGHPLVLISGPCVIESEDVVMRIAERIKTITSRLKIPWIFKASYEKDNRSAPDGFRGPELEEGLRILQKVKERFGVPVTSDVHREADIKPAAEVLDLLQIPAYLCQQTQLVMEFGKAGKPVNVKKGQFLAPQAMKSAVNKLEYSGCDQILLTDRGTCFGYNMLLGDIRSIPIMQSLGYPAVWDPTHIIRLYGISSHDPRGGEPEFVPYLTRAAVAAGTNALFLEAHTNPAEAKCDAASMLDLKQLEALLRQAQILAVAARQMGVDG